jgi:hypothetical protein
MFGIRARIFRQLEAFIDKAFRRAAVGMPPQAPDHAAQGCLRLDRRVKFYVLLAEIRGPQRDTGPRSRNLPSRHGINSSKQVGINNFVECSGPYLRVWLRQSAPLGPCSGSILTAGHARSVLSGGCRRNSPGVWPVQRLKAF